MNIWVKYKLRGGKDIERLRQFKVSKLSIPRLSKSAQNYKGSNVGRLVLQQRSCVYKTIFLLKKNLFLLHLYCISVGGLRVKVELCFVFNLDLLYGRKV